MSEDNNTPLDITSKVTDLLRETYEVPSSGYYFSPSSLPLCPRRVYYDSKDPVEDLQTYFREFYTEVGKGIHKAVQTHLGRAGILYGEWKCWKCNQTYYGTEHVCPECRRELSYREVTLQTPYFNGRVDGLLLIDDKYYLLEIKSVFSDSKWAEVTHGNLPHSWRWQTMFYSSLLRDQGIKVESVVFLLVNPSKPYKPVALSLPPTKGIHEGIFHKWEEIQSLLEKDAKEDEFSLYCDSEDMGRSLYCPYTDRCFSTKE